MITTLNSFKLLEISATLQNNFLRLFFLTLLVLGNTSSAQEPIKKDLLKTKNIFSIFSVNTQNLDLNKYSQRIPLTKKISLTYINELKFAGSNSAILRMSGIEYNLFYFKLNKNNKILSVLKIDFADPYPEYALTQIADLDGAKLLADKYNLSLDEKSGIAERYSIDIDLMRAKKEALDEIVSSDFERNFKVDSDQAYPVLQHEFVVAKYDDENIKNAIKTFGAGPCIIMVIYDEGSKLGMLAHVDALTDMKKSMRVIQSRFNKEGGFLQKDKSANRSLEAYLIGGNTSSREQIMQLTDMLSNYNLKLNKALLTGSIESAWLDLESGEIFKFKVDPELKSNEMPDSFGEILSLRFMMGSFPLTDKSPIINKN